MSPPRTRIVIIGARVGGFTLALLRRRGVAAEVLEQATELREAGAGIALASNATRCCRSLAWAITWPGYRPSPPRSSTATAATATRSRPTR